MVRRDVWSAAASLVLAAVLYAATLRIEGNPLVAIGPDFYPRVLVVLLAVLALCLLGSSLAGPRRRAGRALDRHAAGHESGLARGATSRRDRLRVIGVFGIFVAYAIALPWVGFRLANFAFLAGMRILLGPVEGMRGWLGVVLFALLGTTLAWFVFEQYLSVLLPRGRLSGF